MRNLRRTHGDEQSRATASDEQRRATGGDEERRALGNGQARVARLDAWRRVVACALVVVYVVLWAGGAGHYLLVGAVDGDETWLASAFLAVAGAFVLLTTVSRRDLLSLFAVACAGFVIELCGVHYGVPFGRYVYTGVLKPNVFGVPIVMAFAWMTLIAYLKQTVAALKLSPWASALASAAWMTAIDLVIDPLAANQLDYWRWAQRGAYYGIPLTNFAGWFVSSLLIFALLGRRPWSANGGHRLIGASIVLFFTLVALSFQLWTAALVGLALCVLDVLLYAKRRRS